MRTLESDAFLTEEEVVARYRHALSAGTLRNWRSKGQGPAFVHVGRAVLYARRDLEAWEAQQRVSPEHTRDERPESGSRDV